MPHGAALVRFGEAVSRRSDDTEAARAALLEAVGTSGLVEASGIVGIFNGLVRAADSSGIPLDDGTRKASSDFRATLGLEGYAGAKNTDLSVEPSGPSPTDVDKIFR